MHIIILGSGVVGLTSAWYLTQAGHRVTVVDRQPRSAEETSFANAGQISYGYSSPWAAPGIPTKAIRWLFEQHAPLKVSPKLSPSMIRWASQMLVNCQTGHYQRNKSRMLKVALHSRSCLAELRQQLAIDYQGRQMGTLQVFRNHKQLKAIEKDMALLEQSGTRYQLMDAAECIAQEPGLAPVQHKLVGGLYLPDDETGDCYQFCQQLTEYAQAAGVEFLFETEVVKVETQGDSITGLRTQNDLLQADAYVVAAGSFSPRLLRPLGIDLPVYPVKGYSLTLPVIADHLAPQSTIMDETYKVAITRFDDRIRVAGTAELNGFNTELPQKRLATLQHVIGDLFPQGTDLSQADYWSGLRPMTPDGTPIIGQTPYNNLFTNTGHGTLGWTMACGSAQILADVISHGESEVLAQPELSLHRYAS
ncbi:D-amino acid dehydrogenase [Vibrio sp.]|uniref:D-amino acid dehydrogenase n=1 Tax=Vibrio sp. TaxID=678 RepID=UPI003D0AF65D